MLKYLFWGLMLFLFVPSAIAQHQSSPNTIELTLVLDDTVSADYPAEYLEDNELNVVQKNIQPWLAFGAHPISDSLENRLRKHSSITDITTETIEIETSNINPPDNLSKSEREAYKKDLGEVGSYKHSELTFEYDVDREKAEKLLQKFGLQSFNLGFGDQRTVVIQTDNQQLESTLQKLEKIPFVNEIKRSGGR